MVGLAHLAELMARPDHEAHVTDLIKIAFAAPREPNNVELGDAGEHLDERARADYETRLRDARQDLAEAERHADQGRRQRLNEEIEFLAAELARGFGLGGRSRRAASANERARISVSRAIKYAINKIGDHDPALADHLRRSVRTGAFCAYAPSMRDRVAWTL
jgi:non-specific serine/threonine protein kinase